MVTIPSLPDAKNIPALAINVDGLKRYSFLMTFVHEAGLSPEELKLRSWFLHTVTTASRHYMKARQLVASQNLADQVRDGGAIFYILEVHEHLEGAVMAAHRVSMALRRLSESNADAAEFVSIHGLALAELASIRNQYEHMHGQITSSQTGKGPISMSFVDEGKKIKFRNLTLDSSALHGIIEAVFRVVAKMYPSFDADSPPEVGGPAKLTMRVEISELPPSM